MELTYSNQLDGFDPEKRYRNPEHFDKPEAGVTSVVVVGSWPCVVDAYENVGIDVTVNSSPKVVLATSLSDEHDGALRRELEVIGVIVEGFANGELVRPNEGDTALLLHQVLEAVNAGIESLRTERDGEAEKVAQLNAQLAELQAQVQALKAGGADAETDELKAKLNTAGVSFRANASKESLEKLVAELPKQ